MSNHLEEITAILDEVYDGEEGVPIHIAPTGEPYVTLVCGGIKPEGETWPLSAATEKDAVIYWLGSFCDYALGRGSKLYWRKRPEIFEDLGRYRVYARLLVSDQPVLDDYTNKTGEFERLLAIKKPVAA